MEWFSDRVKVRLCQWQLTLTDQQLRKRLEECAERMEKLEQEFTQGEIGQAEHQAETAIARQEAESIQAELYRRIVNPPDEMM